ncbi:MAG: DUF3617 domain-containing protein [Erythrobacter sp.]
MPNTKFAALALGAAALATAPAVLIAQNDGQMLPQAGEYRSQVTLQSLDMPNAPPQVADMMRSMMSREFTYCLTPEDVAEGYRAMTDRSQQGDCTYERFDASGGKIDAVMSCTTDGRRVDMTMQGTGTPTSSDVTMRMSGDMGMGPGSMTMHVTHQRIGDC